MQRIRGITLLALYQGVHLAQLYNNKMHITSLRFGMRKIYS